MNTQPNAFRLMAVLTLFVSSAFIAGTASAQGHGMFHHSTSGYLGAANHFTYGDMHNNYEHMHHGQYRGANQSYMQHSNMYPSHMQHSGGVHSNRVSYSGGFNGEGHPTGNLHPGMMLPDGSIVVSVGQ